MGPRTPGKARFVYFILDKQSGAVKIGASSNPDQRLKGLQTAHPFELRLLFYVEGKERDYHDEFVRFHLRGEWFRYTGRLREFCEDGIRRGRRSERTDRICGTCRAEFRGEKLDCLPCRRKRSRFCLDNAIGRSGKP